jgi:hypothetical protein
MYPYISHSHLLSFVFLPYSIPRLFLHYSTPALYCSQQLQMSRDPVDHTPRTRSDAQHGRRARRDLCAPCVVNDLRAKTEADGLRLQDQQFVLAAVAFQGDFGLAKAFPAAQDWVRGGVWGLAAATAQEGFVAGERGVGALCGDFP